MLDLHADRVERRLLEARQAELREERAKKEREVRNGGLRVVADEVHAGGAQENAEGASKQVSPGEHGQTQAKGPAARKRLDAERVGR